MPFVIDIKHYYLEVLPYKQIKPLNFLRNWRFYLQIVLLFVVPWVTRFLVELEGVEPSSKQCDHTFSTCLFQLNFSCISKTWTTNRCLSSLLISPSAMNKLINYPRYYSTAIISKPQGLGSERCLVPPALQGNKASLLYFD